MDELTRPYLLSESSEAEQALHDMEDMLAALGGQNLAEGPLSPPEWSIDVDHAEGQQMVDEIEAEYDAWVEEAEQIWEDWQRDREVVDRYYWRYVMEPHLNDGSRLDERTMRRIATFIAEGTTITGRPLTEAFPEVEELMMSRYNPDEESLLEKFGVFNLVS